MRSKESPWFKRSKESKPWRITAIDRPSCALLLQPTRGKLSPACFVSVLCLIALRVWKSRGCLLNNSAADEHQSCANDYSTNET